MPFYDYRCENCGDFEELAKINERNKVKCPECNKKATLLLSANSVKGEPSTIGALADANTKKMGRYEKEDRMIADGSAAKNQAREEMRHQYKLASLTPKQKETYIHEGKLP